MDSVEKATQSQLANIQAKTGKTLEQLFEMIRESGLTKHTEVLSRLKETLNLGHGDANALALAFKKAGEGAQPAVGGLLDALYPVTKAGLREIHEFLMAEVAKLGPFEAVPKKDYVSLRRKKQFAMVGPGTKGRLEVGLNLKGAEPHERLVVVPPGGMCQLKVFLSSASEIDAELLGWVRQAYESAQ